MIARLQAALGKRKQDEGFTLIELLVVVLIIGILAAIAIPIYIGQQATARENAVEAQITNAKTALVAYMTNEDFAGTTLPNLADAGFTPSADIKVAVIGTTAGFCIGGAYGASATAPTHVISDSSAAVPVTDVATGDFCKGKTITLP